MSEQPYGYPQQQPWAGPQPGYDPSREPTIDEPYYGIKPIAALKRGFVKYARFDGRASRSEYWWFVLLTTVVVGIVGSGVGLSSVVFGEKRGDGSYSVPPLGLVFLGLLFLLLLALVIPTLSLLFRRLHDGNFSGWMILLRLFPGVGDMILTIFAILPSSPAGARFDRYPSRPSTSQY